MSQGTLVFSLHQRPIRVSTDTLSQGFLRAFGRPSVLGGFDPTPDLDFHISLREPEPLPREIGPGSHHFRQGDEHVWRGSTPAQVQTLAPGLPWRATLQVSPFSASDGSLLARPGVDAISTWAVGQEVYPLHASGIERGGRAVLFFGEGGRGKTTTAVSMAQRGWNLIADDRTWLCREGPDVMVSGLYDSVILTEHTASLFGQGLGEYLGQTHHGKLAFALPEGMRTQANPTLSAVISLNRGSNRPYSLGQVSPREAVAAWQQALTPSIQAIGPTRQWLSNLSFLVSKVPVFSMTLGWDWARIAEAVNELLTIGNVPPSIGGREHK